MFSPKQALLSAALCAALTAPSQASAPMRDENTSTNSTSLAAPAAPWDIETSNAAKVENANHPLMSLNRGTLTELCQILAENGAAESIIALGQTSIHMAGRILRPVGGYPGLFQDEDMRINNPDMRQAIRVELRKAINARAEELATLQKASEAQSGAQPKARLLAPWKELLGENASIQHLIWARQMLKSDNVERLGKKGLVGQLSINPQEKTLMLAANAADVFWDTHGWDGYDLSQELIHCVLESQRSISDIQSIVIALSAPVFIDLCCTIPAIAIALQRGRSSSEARELINACLPYLTAEMDSCVCCSILKAAFRAQRPVSETKEILKALPPRLFNKEVRGKARVIEPALNTHRPVPEIKRLIAACTSRYISEMSLREQIEIIEAALQSSRSVPEIAQMIDECAASFNAYGEGFVIASALRSSRRLCEIAPLLSTTYTILNNVGDYNTMCEVAEMVLESKRPVSGVGPILEVLFPLNKKEVIESGIARAAIKCLRPASEVKEMIECIARVPVSRGHGSTCLYARALGSQHSLPELRIAIQKSSLLMTVDMGPYDRGNLIRTLLPLSLALIDALQSECNARPGDSAAERLSFIESRAREIKAG